MCSTFKRVFKTKFYTNLWFSFLNVKNSLTRHLTFLNFWFLKGRIKRIILKTTSLREKLGLKKSSNSKMAQIK